MSNDALKVIGAMKATLVRSDGTVEVTKKNNIIVKVGFDFICNCLANKDARPDVLSHIAVGSNNEDPTIDDTALKAEVARQAAIFDHVAGSYTFTMTTTFGPSTGSASLTEAGVFNNAAAGIMFDRVKFDEINKGDADGLTIQFSFTLS